MSEKYFKLDYGTTTGVDLVAFRQELELTQAQMALFLNVSRPTYINKIERSDEVIARLLNADQRHTLRVLLNADGMSLWLDYLSISFKMRTAEWLVKTLLQSGYDLFIQRDGGRFGYSITYAFAGQAFITVYGKKDAPESLITVSGQGIRILENMLMQQDRNIFDFLSLALDNGGHVTRIDYAFNDMERIFNIFDLYKIVEAKRYTQKFRSEPTFIGNGQSGGATMYFGSRSGQVFFRFYEKDKEQATKRHIPHEEIGIKNRYEIELKQDRAQTLAQHLVEKRKVGPELFAYFQEYVRFYDVPVDKMAQKEIDKLQQWAPWRAFLQQASVVEYVAQPVDLSMARSLDWFITQVAPTLKALILYFGQETIDEIIDDAELSPRQKKLLSVAEKVNLPF